MSRQLHLREHVVPAAPFLGMFSVGLKSDCPGITLHVDEGDTLEQLGSYPRLEHGVVLSWSLFFFADRSTNWLHLNARHRWIACYLRSDFYHSGSELYERILHETVGLHHFVVFRWLLEGAWMGSSNRIPHR